jgi:hypothetical protein
MGMGAESAILSDFGRAVKRLHPFHRKDGKLAVTPQVFKC